MKQRFIGTILLFVMLSACSQTAKTALPVETALPIETALPVETSQPTAAPTNTEAPVTAAPTGVCPTETVDLKLFTNAEEGYCFLYPAEYVPAPPRMVVINPNGSTGGDFLPGDAMVIVNMEAASGRTAAQVADQKIAEAGGGFDFIRSEVLLDGKPAIVVDGLPAQDSWRVVFIVGNDRLYTLFFQPWEPGAEWFPKLETLYATVMDSFHVISSMT